MADQYLHVGQTDLVVNFVWYEDLTGYTAKLCYRVKGAASETQKVAAVTPGAEQSITEYEFTGADTTPFPAAGTYVFEFEITSPSGRKRRCRPKEVYAHAQGTGGRK